MVSNTSGDAHGRRQRFDHAAHQEGFVGALGEGHAQVQAMRAAFHLLPGDLQDAFKIFGQDQLLEFRAALGVERSPIRKGAGSCCMLIAWVAEARRGGLAVGRGAGLLTAHLLDQQAADAPGWCRSSRQRC